MTRITTMAAALVVGADPVGAAHGPRRKAAPRWRCARRWRPRRSKATSKPPSSMYRALAKNPDRAIAAQALVRMAGCHQKLGDAQARAIYEQVVRDFARSGRSGRRSPAPLYAEAAADRSVRGDRAVWTGPEVDMFGRVSPDGTFITYVDWGGAGNLMLRDLTTGTSRPLTAYDTTKPYSQFAEGSTVSPDSKEVVYSWFAPQQRRELRRLKLEWLACAGSDRPVRGRRRRRLHLADGLVSRRQVDCGGGEPEGRHRADTRWWEQPAARSRFSRQSHGKVPPASSFLPTAAPSPTTFPHQRRPHSVTSS